MNKLKWMSADQKKVYQHLVHEKFANHEKNASQNAYRELLTMSEYEVQQYVRRIEGRPTDADLLTKLRKKYTESELQMIANGIELKTEGVFRIATTSKHHKIGVLSDTHIGSIYSPAEWLQEAFDTFEKEGCELVLHCGDLTEGMKAARIGTQMYEIEPDCLGYPAMRDAAIKAWEGCKLPTYIISGNHDRFFQDNANIVEDICERLPNMHYIGNGAKECQAMLFDGALVLLFHGEDGFSNTRLKNLAYSERVGLLGISMVLAGHVHKFEEKYIDGCYMFNVPCMQKTSGWMRRKKLYADTGYLILEFDVEDKKIKNLKTQYYNL